MWPATTATHPSEPLSPPASSSSLEPRWRLTLLALRLLRGGKGGRANTRRRGYALSSPPSRDTVVGAADASPLKADASGAGLGLRRIIFVCVFESPKRVATFVRHHAPSTPVRSLLPTASLQPAAVRQDARPICDRRSIQIRPLAKQVLVLSADGRIVHDTYCITRAVARGLRKRTCA